ncbi:MAG: HNH endonuclease [Eubacterium sp.]|nr:HNH endonuclease [Eubacterium sp.]
MNLPYEPSLEINNFSRLFDNTSECYKFFWFQAILTKILEGKDTMTFEELIDEMIADAWYMVTEYHLNLGPNDALEKVVNYLQETTQMKSSEKKEVILEFLKNCSDREVNEKKRTLRRNVPYRLQAPFMEYVKGKEWNVSERARIAKINQEKRLIYYFSEFNGMNTTIRIEPDWLVYIHKNQEIIRGWIQYNMITYLQRRNPSVPGIVEKLYPPQERKLEKVKKYWKLLLELHPMKEIYGHNELNGQSISIDHFVPWSYVAHDEFWNLHPTTKSINSSKSNNLPDWDIYFPQLVSLEYQSYEMMWKYDSVHAAFEKCAKEHLNSFEIQGRLYREGLSLNEFSDSLEEVIRPVYQSAKNCGFRNWIYSE